MIEYKNQVYERGGKYMVRTPKTKKKHSEELKVFLKFDEVAP